MKTEERLAVLEAKLERNEKDITALFKLIREHMKKEEQDRLEFLAKVNETNELLAKQKSFVGGMVFAISSVWAVIALAIVGFIKLRS